MNARLDRRLFAAGLILGLTLPLGGRRQARAAFEDLGAGARAPGMGNAFTAVADDVYAIYYNPAGLALLTKPELATSYSKLFQGLSDGSDLSASFVGYAHPLKGGEWGATGAAWQQLSLNNSLYQESAFYLSYGRLAYKNLGPGDLYAGASIKYLRRSFGAVPEASNAIDTLGGPTGKADPVLSGNNKVGVPDADIGLLYRFQQNYAFGLSLLHVMQPNVAFGAGAVDTLPLSANAAISYRSLLSVLTAEYKSSRAPDGSQDSKIVMAAERWFPRLFVGDFGLRGGLGIGSRDYKQVALGLTYKTGRLSVDYGFSLPITGIAGTSGSHRFGLSFRFGAAAAPDESVEMILEAMRKLKAGAAPELQAQGRGLSYAQKTQLDEYVARAKALEMQAKYQEALDSLTQAINLSPSDDQLLKSYGRLNFIAQRIKELPSYKTDPVQAALHQGVLAYLAGNDALAVERVTYALSLNPGDKGVEGFLSQLALAAGVARPEVPQQPPAQYRLEQMLTQASSAIEEGQYEKAIELSRTVLKEDGGNLSAWENLGTSYFALGDYANSLKSWEKAYALEKNPARRAVLGEYIKSVKNVRRKPRAEAPQPAAAPPAQAPAEAKPAAAPAKPLTQEVQKLYNDAVDYYTSGQLDKAKQTFEKILELEPDNIPAAKALKRVNEELAPK